MTCESIVAINIIIINKLYNHVWNLLLMVNIICLKPALNTFWVPLFYCFIFI